MRIHILRLLYDHAYVGNVYLPIEEFSWGLPAHAKDMKVVRKTVKSLIRDGYLLQHKKNEAFSLNPRCLTQIRTEIY